MSTCVPSSARHAALAVHAMAEADRAWLLAALPPRDRDSLQSLLSELRGLGIPADTSSLAPLLEDAAARAAPTRAITVLGEDALAELASVLRNEPARFAATLLAAGPWSWQRRWLESFAPKQMHVRQETAPAAPALQDAVVRAVERRLATRPTATSAPSRRRSLWQQAIRALNRFGRLA